MDCGGSSMQYLKFGVNGPRWSSSSQRCCGLRLVPRRVFQLDALPTSSVPFAGSSSPSLACITSGPLKDRGISLSQRRWIKTIRKPRMSTMSYSRSAAGAIASRDCVCRLAKPLRLPCACLLTGWQLSSACRSPGEHARHLRQSAYKMDMKST